MIWNIIIWLALGALAGWIASKIMGTKVACCVTSF